MKEKIEKYFEQSTGMKADEIRRPRKHKIWGLEEAALMIKSELTNKHTSICIFADYDVDGITSAVILDSLFKCFGRNVDIRFPKRFTEGYGLNKKAVDEFNEKYENVFLITVDNGISSIDEVAYAKSLGMKVLVLDHHLPSSDGILPTADWIVDPWVDERNQFKEFCGAGLSYRLAEMLLKNQGFELHLDKMAAFAAIGTIGDVVNVTNDNALIIKRGFKAIRQGHITLGLGKLLSKYGKDCFHSVIAADGKKEYLKQDMYGNFYRVSEKDIAFRIVSALNAPARLDDNGAEVSFNLLTIDNGQYAPAMANAQMVYELNEFRKEKVKTLMQEFMALIENDPAIILYSPNCSVGLNGLVAGKIAEETGKITFIFGGEPDENGVIRGSARSGATGIDIFNDILVQNAKLLESFGGHEAAAGCAIRLKNFEEFKKSVQNIAFGKTIQKELPKANFELESSKVNSFIKEVYRYAPLGQNNPSPKVKINFCPLPNQDGGFYKEITGGIKMEDKNLDVFIFDSQIVEQIKAKKTGISLILIGCLEPNYFKERPVRITMQPELVEFTEVMPTKLASTIKNQYR